ncbi:DUF3127 domain-containing protein [Rubritalea marina]|uniref:DUF3127 domain-containing protein n=1 Tax=Rubritalea marina TaxID=361055 RepID=UPI0003646AC3|nr:DUF3127 domain-containing protein [Rubritalea marina]
MFELSGKIKLIDQTQTFNSGFTKREFVITTSDSKYPQDIKFEVVKDRCEQLDQYALGQEVLVNFDVRGNEYNGRHYVNLNCWKIQAAGNAGAAPAQEPSAGFPANEPEPSPSDLRSPNYEDSDDIPF